MQAAVGTHWRLAEHVSLAAQARPPVPPHLQRPSLTSQLVPGWVEQSTRRAGVPVPASTVQRVCTQVLVRPEQIKPSLQATPPRPPHLQTPSPGSHVNGALQVTLEHRFEGPEHEEAPTAAAANAAPTKHNAVLNIRCLSSRWSGRADAAKHRPAPSER